MASPRGVGALLALVGTSPYPHGTAVRAPVSKPMHSSRRCGQRSVARRAYANSSIGERALTRLPRSSVSAAGDRYSVTPSEAL
jgi:hypothetical protein